jgi:hypothetical protein
LSNDVLSTAFSFTANEMIADKATRKVVVTSQELQARSCHVKPCNVGLGMEESPTGASDTNSPGVQLQGTFLERFPIRALNGELHRLIAAGDRILVSPSIRFP